MKIELIILLVLSVLVNSSIGQVNYDDGPCGHWRPGDADLGTWDIISSFGSSLDELSVIEGSNSIQSAYRFEKSANLTMRAHEAFPRGTPFQFSFECTYRQRKPQPTDPWHLFHLTNSHEESQLSVTLNPSKQTLQVSLPDARGDLQTAEFRHSALFDQRWHKIMLGVTDSRAKLWVDCQPVKSIQGNIEYPLRERGQYDTHDGYLSIAQIANTRSYQSAPPIDLQWMVMTCDPNRPMRQNCDEIPGYDVAGVAPDFLEGPPPKPCQTCPAGPPGFNGTDGRPGARGERGMPGPMGIPGFSAPPVKGEKGEQGLRGFDGRPGENGRDGLPGLIGERGPQGLPGLPGIVSNSNIAVREGQKGERGEPGLIGLQGQRGERGYAGIDGRPGVDGAKGEKGDMGPRGYEGPAGPPGPPGPGGETSEARGMGVHYVLGGGAGPRGEPGSPGPRGQPGQPGENGIPGRSFTEEDVREICYNVLRGQLEELTARLQGPPGAPGVSGKRGPHGPQGNPGPPGEKGRQGFQGLQGLPGLPGPHGEQGYQGERGEKGERGERGEEGIGRVGPPGPQGPQGSPGPDGVQGNPGSPGRAGEQGSIGNVGPRGPPGNPGQCPVDCYQAMSQANALYYNRVQGNQKGP